MRTTRAQSLGRSATAAGDLGELEARRTTLALYAFGTATMILALQLRAEHQRGFSPSLRSQHRPPPPSAPRPDAARDEAPADAKRPAACPASAAPSAAELPAVRLHPDDPAANAVLLAEVLARVPGPGEAPPPGMRACDAAPRLVPIQLAGRLSLIHFGSHPVCQLAELKRISAAQPSAGPHGVGEVAAFLLGVRSGDDVTVTRVVVPPFRFTGETLTFVPRDLGPLAPGERFLGTWHTHPDGDLEQGLLSFTDLVYMRTGFIDFHGAVGPLAHPDDKADWLLDMVDPRDGDWNIFAHDGARLRELTLLCQLEATCPLNELRLPGSRFFLQARHYADRGDVRHLFDGIARSGGFLPTVKRLGRGAGRPGATMRR